MVGIYATSTRMCDRYRCVKQAIFSLLGTWYLVPRSLIHTHINIYILTYFTHDICKEIPQTSNCNKNSTTAPANNAATQTRQHYTKSEYQVPGTWYQVIPVPVYYMVFRVGLRTWYLILCGGSTGRYVVTTIPYKQVKRAISW